MKGAALSGLLCLCSGCHLFYWGYRHNPDNPIPDVVKKVAVAPFFDLTGNGNLLSTDGGYTGLKVAEIFSSELVQFRGFEVVRPGEAARLIEREKIPWSAPSADGPRQAVRLARALGVDALIVGAITEFDPYDRPRIGVAVQVYVARTPRPGLDLDRLIKGGRPFPAPPGARQGLLLAFERIYDASHSGVYNRAKAYGVFRHDSSGRAVTSAQMILFEANRYLQFVSNQAIREIVAFGADIRKAQKKAAARPAAE